MLWQQTMTRGDLTGPVTIVQITPDGRHVVACVLKDSIVVCDASKGTELCRWQGLDRIHAMAADNKRVICGDSLGLMSELRIDENESQWRPMYQWSGHDSKLSSIAMIAPDPHGNDSTELVSTDREGKVWQWFADSRLQTKTFPPLKGVPGHHHNSVCWKDATALLRSQSNGIQCLNIKSGESEDAFYSSTSISSVRYSMEMDRLVVADSTGQVCVIPRDRSKTSVISVWKDQFIDGILIDQSGSRALAFDQKQNVAVLDLHKNEVLLRLADRESSAISPDGRWIVSADRNSDAFDVFDGETLERIKILEDVDPTYEDITFSQDSRLFVSAGSHRMVTVWESETWSLIQQISVPSRDLRMPAFHPDGRTLAIADESGFIRLIDIRSGRELFILGPHSSTPFHGLGFSPDGSILCWYDQNWNLQLISVGE